MEQINRSKLITCPHCELTVLPEADGTCPSCQRQITERVTSSAVPAEETDTPELEIEEELELEEETAGLEEELAEAESWLSSEPDYATYLRAADRITHRFWGIVITSISFSVLFLGAFAYFGFKNLFGGDPITAAVAFVIALAMPAMLVSFGIAQSNKNAEEEVSRLLMEFPGFDVFYELYRPHLRNRFWKKEKTVSLEELFVLITTK